MRERDTKGRMSGDRGQIIYEASEALIGTRTVGPKISREKICGLLDQNFCQVCI